MSSMEACCVFPPCFITSEEVDALAETLLSPETPKVSCGLKHITQTSIGKVVRR